MNCCQSARGYAKTAPFDRIISAASGEVIPKAWKQQLKVGGRVVLPIEHTIILMIKIGENNFETQRFEGFSFVSFMSDTEPDE